MTNPTRAMEALEFINNAEWTDIINHGVVSCMGKGQIYPHLETIRIALTAASAGEENTVALKMLISAKDAEIQSLKSHLAAEEHECQKQCVEKEALKQQINAQGWRDISTCPKPSGQVLLLAEGGVYNGHWYAPYSKWEYDCHFYPKSQPTMWMPLPQPPGGEV